MLPIDQVETCLLNLGQPVCQREILPLDQAVGRVLAESVVGFLDLPGWDTSAMDGYALRGEDVTAGPTELTLVESIAAGTVPAVVLTAGTCARIFTGAILPPGADTVVPQEQVEAQGSRVKVLQPPCPGEFVRRQGEFYRRGTPLLAAGLRLRGPELALLAAVQSLRVAVWRRPRIALFSTGNELVQPGHPLNPGQIVDSNQLALAALIREAGGEVTNLGIVPDQPAALARVIGQALGGADLVVSTGGVSVGDYDYIPQVLAALGMSIPVHGVAIKPGKPLLVATGPGLYLGLPGNPASALVLFWRFVQPLIRRLAGLAAWEPQFMWVHSRDQLLGGGPREIYLWGQLLPRDEKWEFVPAPGSFSSGNLVNLAQTTALAVLPVGSRVVESGELVRVLLTRPLT